MYQNIKEYRINKIPYKVPLSLIGKLYFDKNRSENNMATIANSTTINGNLRTSSAILMPIKCPKAINSKARLNTNKAKNNFLLFFIF